MSYIINLGDWNKVFLVPSCVVDKYIKLASGNNIKVLLYFLNNAGEKISVEQVSKATGIKEEDCEDALVFWNETGLLKTCGDELLPAIAKQEHQLKQETALKKHEFTELSAKKIKLERETEFYPKDIADAVCNNKEIDFLFEYCEKLYNRPLKHVERNMLMTLIDDINLPTECVLMLIEYCHSVNKATPAYIKTIAADWVERNILNVDEVEKEIKRLNDYSEKENEFKKIFEFNSAFSKNQREYIKKWAFEYGFTSEMIEEAYQKTLDGAGKLSFPYMNKILEVWFSKGILDKEKLALQEKLQKDEKEEEKQSSFDIDEVFKASMEKYGEV